MKKFMLVALLLSLGSTVHAESMAETCASLQVQLEKLGANGEQMMRDMGMGEIIDDCTKEDTQSYKDQMASGTLYCKSGSLCGQYDFQYAADRTKYLAGCNQVPSCPSENITDTCSLKNDKVRGGRGTVDWTIYAYNGLVRDSAANLACN